MNHAPSRPRSTKATDPALLEYGTVIFDTTSGQVTVSGPHGKFLKANAKQPAEVGLAVIEAMSGSKVGNVKAYRKGKE